MKNILFVRFSSNNVVLTAIEFELFRKYKNHNIIILSCDNALESCTININNYYGRCRYCRYLSNMQIQQLKKELINFTVINLSDYLSNPQVAINTDEIKNIEDLYGYKYEPNLDCGMEVASTLISHKSTVDIDVDSCFYQIKKMLHSSIAVYEALLEIVKCHNVNTVIVPNGRTLPRRSVLRAAQFLKVECLVFDGSGTKYDVAKNCMLHDREHVENSMEDIWGKYKDNCRLNEFAGEFYEKVKKNHFVKSQIPNKGPKNWKPKKKNICIFTSSDFEFAAISNNGENVAFYRNQVEAINSIAKEASSDVFDLYVRVHPNSANTTGEVITQSDFYGENVYALDPSSRVDTYWLVKNCDVVISFGTTVGIESVYYRKPVIILSDFFYCDGDMHKPRSHGQLIEMLHSDLKPKGIISSYKYALYRMMNGKELSISPYFNGESFVEFDCSKARILLFRFLNFLDLLHRRLMRSRIDDV